MLSGCDIGYDSGAGTTGFKGVTENGVPPPVGSYVYDVGYYTLTNNLIGTQGSSIFRIDGSWSFDGYIRYIQFTFKDNGFTKFIPSSIDNNGDSKLSFTIIPPSGYFLSSLWMPDILPDYAFYSATLDVVFGFQDFSRYENSTEAITFDPRAWAEDCPVAGSSNWVEGYSVQYAIAWIYQDKNFSNLTPWCDPIFGGPWAMPTLLLPTSTDPNIVGRQLFRKFATSIVQNITTLDATTVRYAGTTP